MEVQFNSKLPNTGTTIFSVMSALANQHNAINLSQGFPNYDCDPNLHKLVTKYMSSAHNQYAPMPGLLRLREQIAKKAARLYQNEINPETEVTVTAGATQAIYTAISAFIRPEDQVIIIEPAYDSYRPSVELNKGMAVPYELRAPDYKIDWDHFKKLMNIRTKMIIINSPQNPSASILSAQDMEQLEKLTDNTDIIILSDEVYEHIIFDNESHQSVLKYPGLYQRSLSVYSFGKTYHVTGWKMGYCIGPEYLMKEFRKVHQFNVFAVNRPMQHALADFMEDTAAYEGLATFYQQKRDLFVQALEGSRFKVIPSAGTYFQLADYSAISEEPDTEFVKRLTIEHGVAAIPVSVFYSSKRQENIIRFCFAKTDDLLLKAGQLLQKI